MEKSLDKIAGRENRHFFYEANGLYRQYVYKQKKLRQVRLDKETALIAKIKAARGRYKYMGARVMYHHLKIEEVGINQFERIVSKAGLSVKVRKRRIVTTHGVYEDFDTNLINGKVLTGINQVIAGDITYFLEAEKPYYIFTLKDMYSKRIVGLYGSESLKATSAVKTLRQAIKLRGEGLKDCIHHSDAGSQYKSKVYKTLLAKHHLTMSIAENCLQNGMAEQLNGLIKNGYMPRSIKNIKELNKVLDNIKQKLNEEIPVKALGYMTPKAYEEALESIPKAKRDKIEIYDFKKERECSRLGTSKEA